MSVLAVLVPLAIAAVVGFVAVALFGRGREPLDLSPQSLFRAYLYVASFAGVVVATFGAAALITSALAAFAGTDFVYGSPPPASRFPQQPELDARRAEDLVRGLTFAIFGVLFWLVHWLARNRTGEGDQGALQRGYLLLGAAVFAVASILLLPMGIYQALAFWLVPRGVNAFRPGVQDSLGGGVASFVVWLLFLRIVLSQLPRGPRRGSYRYPPGAPPAEPAGVGARIGPGPASRSAGAEAVPPREER